MTRLFTPIRVTLLIGLLLAFIAGLVLVPVGTLLPVHWGPSGAADQYLPREWALMMPLIVVAGLWALFIAMTWLARPADLEAGRSGFGVALAGLTAIFLVIEVAMVLTGMGMPVNMVQALGFGIGVLLVMLGNAMPKSQPNSLVGLRLPTTLRDAANWQATHRLTGMLCIIGGFVLMVAALMVQAPQLIWWLLACVLLPMLAGSLYSLRHARRHNS